MIQECEAAIEEVSSGVARDVGIVGCCQTTEHYEIPRYGNCAIGQSSSVKPKRDYPTQILDQEKTANPKLTQMAL